MAESVDAPVSNTGGAIHPGSIPGPGTKNIDDHWKDAGVVDRGGLENRCSLTGTQGSNPCPSANWLDYQAFTESAPNITPRNGSNIGCFVGIK